MGFSLNKFFLVQKEIGDVINLGGTIVFFDFFVNAYYFWGYGCVLMVASFMVF